MNPSSPTLSRSQLRLAVLLLAAGEGSRLGSKPKCLLKKNGKTLLECILEAVRPLVPVEFVMLIGFHAQEIETAFAQLQGELSSLVTVVRNPTPELGQHSSIRLGLESLQSRFDALLICLSDQPEITSLEIAELVKAFEEKASDKQVVLPMVNGQRGNPVIFSWQAIQNILAQSNMVCRAYMDSHPDQVQLFYSSNEAYLIDVDTPQDLVRLGLQHD